MLMMVAIAERASRTFTASTSRWWRAKFEELVHDRGLCRRVRIHQGDSHRFDLGAAVLPDALRRPGLPTSGRTTGSGSDSPRISHSSRSYGGIASVESSMIPFSMLASVVVRSGHRRLRSIDVT